ncbi:prion-inhibition and propagation-domain-containing protein [Leptodontidium sp. MPI-SDFR-AT-0119]|nr:prion-inhibition and propagation-domain-containing protein [Leptodontidium sp. MPI-SDFR-AT-0119]
MDPISAIGIALSIAGLAGQVFKGCIQGIQFIITAKDLPEDCRYLNLRLRMEQQRLFAWSETSGLLDLQNSDDTKVRESNTFVVHRTTILDLLVQIQCLFKEFEKAQKKNNRLIVVPESSDSDEELSKDPAKDASNAHVPLPEGRRKFIIKAMRAITTSTKDSLGEGRRRLRWAAFDKEAFEDLLQRFSTLNDNMTDILDARLQTEIHRTTQDTNRGVLQLHKDLASLHRLVQALDIKMQARNYPVPAIPQYAPASDAAGLRLLAQLAKFKAFNESLDTEGPASWNDATAMVLQLGKPETEKANTKIDRSCITLDPQPVGEDLTAIRCEATYTRDGHSQKVWIEWKEYDYQKPGSLSPPPLIIDRVSKLASLLHHTPKPEAFRVPHCLGYFDNAKRPSEEGSVDSEEEDGVDTRIGFIFEKPHDEGVSPDTTPISLFELLSSSPKPRVTERIKVAHAIANCLLYLHSVNWLHKGLRSHNIVFFPTSKIVKGRMKLAIDYSKPYLSGFDFARPARADEMTEIPGDNGAYNMYRHPHTQGQGFGPRESFRKSFDIYSLGVVLVELAHWRTVERVLGVEKGGLRVMGRIREMLLDEERIADVGGNMGELYESATWKCIAGGEELGVGEGVDEMGDVGAARLSMRFYEDVVKRLGDVKV